MAERPAALRTIGAADSCPLQPCSPVAGRPSPRAERLLGIAVLVVTVLAGLIFSGLLSPDEAGRAADVPLPGPPAIGACLMVTPEVHEVSCTEDHHAEVIRTWAAGTIPASKRSFADMLRANPGVAIGLGEYPWVFMTDECTDRQFESGIGRMTHSTTAAWTLIRPPATAWLITAPLHQRTSLEGWSACVIGTADLALYQGKLRDWPVTGVVPTGLGSCLFSRTLTVVTNCATRHHIELLAEYPARYHPDADQLRRSCASVVAAVTHTAEPSYGGRLQMVVDVLLPGSFSVSGEAVAPQPTGTTDDGVRAGPIPAVAVPVPLCAVEVVGDRELMGSVIGLGNHELPLR